MPGEVAAMPFAPKYQITPEAAMALMAIEAARSTVESRPITPQIIASLRESARLLSTHYSTQIEGNRLTAAQVQKVIAGQGGFPGRERDEREVSNYYRASAHAEALAARKGRLREHDIRVLHGLVMDGKARATPYRKEQNVIRDGASGGIVYMPPTAKDVPALMRALVTWINREMERRRLPVPVLAALAHYQYATIHPYYDGNGRTARLLTSLVLHRCGYGLKGIYSLEEYYARNLAGYYAALAVGKSHNYYLGRAKADVSDFVEYFGKGMADAFAKIAAQSESFNKVADPGKAIDLRELRPIQRQSLGLFAQNRVITSRELVKYLGLTARQGRELCAKWAKEGFLTIESPSRKSRSYRLAQKWESKL
jgi:Fic family protein